MLPCVALVVATLIWWGVARHQRELRRVAASQPRRLAALRAELDRLGSRMHEDGYTLALPWAVALVRVLDPRDLDDRDVVLSIAAPRAVTAYAFVQLIVPQLHVPCELALFRRDWLQRRRGVEKGLPRRFRRAFYLAAQPGHAGWARVWARSRQEHLLRLRPDRVYASACHCPEAHASRLEIILDLSRYQRGDVAAMLALAADFAPHPSGSPYRRHPDRVHGAVEENRRSSSTQRVAS